METNTTSTRFCQAVRDYERLAETLLVLHKADTLVSYLSVRLKVVFSPIGRIRYNVESVFSPKVGNFFFSVVGRSCYKAAKNATPAYKGDQ